MNTLTIIAGKYDQIDRQAFSGGFLFLQVHCLIKADIGVLLATKDIME